MSLYRREVGILKALAHPARLHILEVLRHNEACVSHLETVTGKRQAYISQQLARLRAWNLVQDRRDGANIYYSLADPSIGSLLIAAQGSAKALAAQLNQPPDRTPDVPARLDRCPCPRCRARAAS